MAELIQLSAFYSSLALMTDDPALRNYFTVVACRVTVQAYILYVEAA